MFCNQLPILYQNRHCYKDDIDEIVFKSNYCSYNNILDRLSFFKMRKSSSSSRNKITVGSNTFTVSEAGIIDYLKSRGLLVKKLSDSFNVIPDKRQLFCICVFMKELYVIGGNYGIIPGSTNSCCK